MDRLRAGIALYNAGEYLAAHEPIESLWLEDPAGERKACLQGLIQATAAVYKSRVGNRTGAVGLAESGAEYLASCDGEEIDVESLRPWLSRLVSDPTLGERERPPELRLDGELVTLEALRFPAAAAAARALAETHDDEIVRAAVEYAEADLDSCAESSSFVTLTLDYVHTGDAIVRQRLKEHVERRRMRESDVDGLF